MFSILIILFYAFSFGLLYRERGTEHKWCGTQVSRLIFWVFPVFIAMLILCHQYDIQWYYGVASGLLAWLGIAYGHGTSQNNDADSFFELGIVTAGRLAAILLPVSIANPSLPLIYAPVCGLAAGYLGGLSYGTFLQKHTLIIFKRTFCVPGDSSWEELLVGMLFGVIFGSLTVMNNL